MTPQQRNSSRGPWPSSAGSGASPRSWRSPSSTWSAGVVRRPRSSTPPLARRLQCPRVSPETHHARCWPPPAPRRSDGQPQKTGALHPRCPPSTPRSSTSPPPSGPQHFSFFFAERVCRSRSAFWTASASLGGWHVASTLDGAGFWTASPSLGGWHGEEGQARVGSSHPSRSS